MTLRLADSLATTEPLAEVFSDAAYLRAMLRFETALARAEAEAGVIPAAAAEAIAAAADSARFDPVAIAAVSRRSGTVAIPFVEAFRAAVRTHHAGSADYVHRGATSQDVTDTAAVLCLVAARPVLASDTERLARACRRLSDEHARTVMLARTLLQPAPPTTFGLKAAGWHAAVRRSEGRLALAFEESCVLQFGGAAGTLAALGDAALPVAAALGRELELPVPDAPWHTHRDRFATLAAACGIFTGTLAKIARDVSLLMQAEVAEAFEPGGRSSTMPHKRNPSGCAVALAAAGRVPGLVATFLAAMPQEHERGLGGSHTDVPALAAIVQATGSVLAAMADTVETLTVDPERMRANLDATGGAVLAERAILLLAPRIGRDAADRAVQEALEQARGAGGFAEALLSSPDVSSALTEAERRDLGSPEAYLGAAELFRQRLLATPPAVGE